MNDVLQHPYVLVGTIFTALIALAGVIYQANQGQAASCINEGIALREDNERLLRENVNLITKLAKEINTTEVLEATLDGIDHPIWINAVVRLEKPNERGHLVEFRMVRVNKAYQRAYKISQQEYSGKTAFDVWPEAVAQVFYDNDLKALREGTIRTSETFPESALDPTSKLITRKIDKNLITLPTGQDAIIGLAYRFQ